MVRPVQDSTALPPPTVDGTEEGVGKQRRQDFALAGIAAVLDSLGDRAVVVDEHGTVIAANRAWSQEAEQKGDDPTAATRAASGLRAAVGTAYATVCEAADPADVTCIGEGIRAVLTGEQPSFEHTYRFPSDHRWGTIQVTPMVAPEMPRSVLVLHTDATRERATADALRATESRLRAVFDSAGIAIFVIDLKGQAVDVNPALCELLGYQRDELIGRNLHVVLNSGDEAQSAELEEMRLGQRDLAQREGGCVRRDGSVLWARFTNSAVRDELGRLRGVVGMIEDVSESRMSRVALQASEERLRTLVDACPAAIVETDTDRRVRTWNPAAERMFGWRADEVVGQILPIDGPDAAEVAARWDWLLGGHTASALETAHLRKDGEVVNLSLSVAPTKNDAGA
ncbi:MAG: hypothetical protein QOG64_3269, partial [Acidimicrobiaceae bacterium]|nr:hypothetical protein [Acidimicrobiaceae bacterium]